MGLLHPAFTAPSHHGASLSQRNGDAWKVCHLDANAFGIRVSEIIGGIAAMDKLKLGFLVRGTWEASQGNREAAIAAFKVVGDHPLAKSLIAQSSDDQPLEIVIEMYRDAIECGAEDLLITYLDLITVFDSNDERLAPIITRIEEGIDGNNPRILAGLFRERLAAGDYVWAVQACSKAIELRDAQTMSNLAEILMTGVIGPTEEGFKEFIYHLSDKELFNPQPWPVPVVVSVPDSKLWDISGELEADPAKQQEAIRDDFKARNAYHAFLKSLFDQGEDTPLYIAGRLRAIFELTQNTNWTASMIDLFSNRPEESRAFWSDPDLILFYTQVLVSENLHYEVEWIRSGISQYGLEDIFDRVVELALASPARKETEENNYIPSTQAHIYLGERELTIYEGFSETVGGNQALIARIMANPYCKLFDEGRLTDLKSIITQDTKLACLGAESLFEDLSLFLSIGITYGSQGFIDLIGKAIDEIQEANDVPTEFLTMLASLWVEVGHYRFNEENYYVTKLADALLECSKLDQELQSKVKAFFVLRNERERLDAIFIPILEKLRSGINAIPELAAALLSFYESNPDDEDFVCWYWTETIYYELLEVLENSESLWGGNLVTLTLIISEWDPHFACNVISTDVDFETAHLTATDLEVLSQNQDCNDYECDGPKEHASQHPNFN